MGLLIPNLFLSAFFGAHRLRYFLGLQSEDDYLTAHYTIGEGHQVTRFIHEKVPAASKILFLGSQQGFNFYYPDWTLVDMIHYPPSFYNQSAGPWADGLRRDGIGYVVVMDRYFTDNPNSSRHWWPVKGIDLNIPKLVPPHFHELYRTPYATVYAVSSKISTK